MKKDLTTTIIAAIAGVVAAYFITNMFLPGIENFSFKNLNGNTNFTLAEPDEEIFNYRAVNPTVEVYVGQCMEYDADGVCIDYGVGSNSENSGNDENGDNDESSGNDENGGAENPGEVTEGENGTTN